jgi:hypothetical protein
MDYLKDIKVKSKKIKPKNHYSCIETQGTSKKILAKKRKEGSASVTRMVNLSQN